MVSSEPYFKERDRAELISVSPGIGRIWMAVGVNLENARSELGSFFGKLSKLGIVLQLNGLRFLFLG